MQNEVKSELNPKIFIPSLILAPFAGNQRPGLVPWRSRNSRRNLGMLSVSPRRVWLAGGGAGNIPYLSSLPGSPGHGHKSAPKIQSWGKRLGIYSAPNTAGLSFNAAALCISLPPTLFISCLLAQPPLIYVFITLINAPAPLTSLFRRSFPECLPGTLGVK